MGAVSLSKQDKDWRAQDDARTLAVAEEIKKDKVRLGLAANKARELADNAESSVKSLRKIQKMKRRSVSKPTRRSKGDRI